MRWLEASEDAPRGAIELLTAASPPPAFSEAVRYRLALGVAKTAALPVTSLWSSLWVKGVLVATIGGASGLAAHSVTVRREAPVAHAVAPARTAAPVVHRVDPPVAVEELPIAPLDTEPAETAPPDRGPKAKLDPRVEEVELLEKARSLVGVKPAAALKLVAEHSRDFPRGRLGAEADLIAAQALLGMGDVSGAKRRARASLSRYPSGLYARQLRAIAEQ
jgi:hypothetical protein